MGDEPAALGYVDMFTDVLDALEEQRAPREDFYDGYIVNAIIDAAYTSVEGASCLVDLGDGQKPHDATATASYSDNTLEATVTFDDNTVWSFTGSR